MNRSNLCYCILTVQYVKYYCVAGYLLVIIIIIIIIIIITIIISANNCNWNNVLQELLYWQILALVLKNALNTKNWRSFIQIIWWQFFSAMNCC